MHIPKLSAPVFIVNVGIRQKYFKKAGETADSAY